MTASISELFQKKQTIGCYDRAKLWRHFVAVDM